MAWKAIWNCVGASDTLMQNTLYYRSIFSPNTLVEKDKNFQHYWQFCQVQDGELVEAQRDLTRKRDLLRALQAQPVRALRPLADPAAFYRNAVRCRDRLASIDRRTLLFTAIYKLARHEWIGISEAWEATPSFQDCNDVIAKICRYHLAEEFCHIRLFEEMFWTCHLERVVWVPLPPHIRRISRSCMRMLGATTDPLSFVTELMGLMFYRAVDALLDDIFADDPATCQRLRTLLHEITVDELAHVGQRRNFLSPRGVQIARWMIRPVFRAFFHGMPESRYLFNVNHLIADALAFDYNRIPAALLRRSWVPTYCQPVMATILQG